MDKKRIIKAVLEAINSDQYFLTIDYEKVRRVLDIEANKESDLNSLITLSHDINPEINEVLWDLVIDRILTPTIFVPKDQYEFFLTDKIKLEEKVKCLE